MPHPFTHFDQNGQTRMVDAAQKLEQTHRLRFIQQEESDYPADRK